MSSHNVVAILSTTLLQNEGTYQYEHCCSLISLVGIPHFVGHPATRHILDAEGAVYTPGLFAGMNVGESIVVCQLKDPRKGQAFTVDSPNVSADDFKWGVVTRLS